MWIINRFHKWLSAAVARRPSADCVAKERHLCDMPSGFTFKLLAAQGGLVVNVISYNNKTGNQQQNLYILPDGCDVGDELSMIITRERLL